MATTYSSASQQALGRPPPPYAGAPPVPVGVNAQQWQAGFWKFNPAYQARKGQQQVHVPWVPSRHWIPQQQQQQQQQQQPLFNPYKRQPRAPSAEYLATKLVDNPLGLTDMTPISIEEYYRQGQPEPVVHTPWIWNPSTLEDDDDDEQQPQRKREQGDFTEKRELQLTFSSSIVRTPEHYRSPLVHHATMPTSWKLPMFSDRPAISDEPKSMFDADADELGGLLSPLVLATPALPPTNLAPRNRPVVAARSLGTIPEKRSRRPEPRPREQTQDARALTYPAPEQRLGTRHTTALYVPPASTPPHRTGSGPPSPSPYVTPHPTPPGSKEASPGPRGQSTARRSLDPHAQDGNRRPLDSYVQDASRRTSEPYAQDTIRRASAEDHRAHLQDPPPRTNANPLPPPPQPSLYTAPPLMPSRSASAVLAPAPGPAPTYERRPRTSSASAAAAPHTPPHSAPTYPTPTHSASASASASAAAAFAQYAAERTPPHSAPVHAQGPYVTPHTPPHSVRPPYGVPMHSHSTPTRPKHGHTHSTPTHPAHTQSVPVPTQAYPAHPNYVRKQSQSQAQTQPSTNPSPPYPTPLSPALPRRAPRVRRGYWNKRGDHLTPTGFLVYAPPHLAFPEELATYPPAHEGYQDDRGAWCRWVARPELRESLPREGRPAERPYESFVVYVDQPGAQ